MKIKKITKKILCSILVVIMCLTAAPIQGFVDLDRTWFGFNIKANAATVDGYYTYEVYDGKATITDVDTSISGDVTIPSTLSGYPVTSIGYSAFEDCNNLSSITIPDSVTTIDNTAFRDCSSLLSISIPNSVTSIGGSVFRGCSSLSSITIPDSVTDIGNDAFSGCSSLSSIYVDENNEYYSSDSYGVLFNKDKTKLVRYPIGNSRTSYSIPDSVTVIGYVAFEDCTNLSSITIPDSVTDIDWLAFYGCTSLSNISIPDSVTSIGGTVFGGCTGLSSITIPDSMTYIGEFMFEGCTGLSSISIPDSVTNISRNAFSGCTSLSSITIPDSVTSIGGSAFYDCTSLSSITIPDSVTTINYFAFDNCTSLSSITIPDSVTSINYFAFDNCTNLSDVYYSGTEQQWNQIFIDHHNEDLTNATIHYNHKHSYKTVVTASTCTKEGYTTYTCECGDSYTEKIGIDANAHKWDNGTATTTATCKTSGVKTYTCQHNSAHKKTDILGVNASNHVNTNNVAEIPATTENVGYTAGVYCNDCKKYISGHTEIPKLVPEFADSKDAKKKGNDILSNNGLTAAQLLSQADKNAVITTVKGNAVAEKDLIGTGMILKMPDGKTYTIVVFGDVDGSGTVSAADARLTLRASVGLEKYDSSSAQYKASNIESSDKVTAADARLILRASVGLEDTKNWIK